MKAFLQLFVASLLCAGTPTHAQWQWIDEGGRKVFSDRPPPQHISADKVLQKPKHPLPPAPSAASPQNANPANVTSLGGSARPNEPTKASQIPGNAPNTTPTKTEPDTAPATASAQDCQNARNNKAALESGRMVSFINSKGERELMSEEARQQEISYLQEILTTSCPQ